MSISSGFQKGFTLVEVLVAGFLLFISIAIASLSYQASLKTQQAAERQIRHAIFSRFISNAIIEARRVNPGLREGDGVWKGVRYDWRVARSFEKQANSGFDIESRQEISMGPKLILSAIQIEVETQVFEVYDLTWQ